MAEKYTDIGHAERTVDCYGGDSCEEHIPQWRVYSEGDMGDSEDTAPLTLDPKSFPAGTKITIEVPVCPKCEKDAELCASTGCDFDWRQWAEDRYA